VKSRPDPFQAEFNAARQRMGMWPGEPTSPPKLITPQIPTPAREVPTGPEWVHEIKHDGWRAVVRIEGAEVTILTRSARNVTRMFSRMVPALRAIGRNCIIDGEIAAPDENGVTCVEGFSDIVVTEPHRLAYYAFDLLWLDEDWRTRPLLERKARLKTILAPASALGRVVSSDHVAGDHGETLYAFAIDHGCEGIISKRAGSLYRGGQTRDWLKIKPPAVRLRQAGNVREAMKRGKADG